MAKRISPETLRMRFRQLWEATSARCQAPLYLVGSYLSDRETANDVDIVAALGDFNRPRWFDRMRAQIKLSAELSERTGLPIDFKVQNGIHFAGTAAENPVLLLAEPGVPVLPDVSFPERVLCAAIYVNTGKVESEFSSPGYPETGLVFPGWRHNDCFVLLIPWSEGLTDEERAQIEAIMPDQLEGRNQGFLTSAGRYVDRSEGWKVALNANQVQHREHKQSLDSEDLYR